MRSESSDRWPTVACSRVWAAAKCGAEHGDGDERRRDERHGPGRGHVAQEDERGVVRPAARRRRDEQVEGELDRPRLEQLDHAGADRRQRGEHERARVALERRAREPGQRLVQEPLHDADRASRSTSPTPSSRRRATWRQSNSRRARTRAAAPRLRRRAASRASRSSASASARRVTGWHEERVALVLEALAGLAARGRDDGASGSRVLVHLERGEVRILGRRRRRDGDVDPAQELSNLLVRPRAVETRRVGRAGRGDARLEALADRTVAEQLEPQVLAARARVEPRIEQQIEPMPRLERPHEADRRRGSRRGLDARPAEQVDANAVGQDLRAARRAAVRDDPGDERTRDADDEIGGRERLAQARLRRRIGVAPR